MVVLDCGCRGRDHVMWSEGDRESTRAGECQSRIAGGRQSTKGHFLLFIEKASSQAAMSFELCQLPRMTGGSVSRRLLGGRQYRVLNQEGVYRLQKEKYHVLTWLAAENLLRKRKQ